MDGFSKPGLAVAAGILSDPDGRVLIARRPDGADHAGWWEFPGGKIRVGETSMQGLIRELGEELGITVRSATELMTFDHEYSDRIVRLHVWRVTEYAGEPAGREGQPIKWVAIPELMEERLLPADAPIIEELSSRFNRSSIQN